MISRNENLKTLMFGENQRPVFTLDGSANTVAKINKVASAKLRTKVFPIYLYLKDLDETMQTPVLVKFIKQQIYHIIGIENVSTEILKTIFDNLPSTVQKIGVDWVPDEDSFKIIHNAIAKKKREGQLIEVICGINVYGWKKIADLSNFRFTATTLLPTQPNLERSSADLIKTHSAAAQAIKEEFKNDDPVQLLLRQRPQAIDFTTAIARQVSEVGDFKRELSESNKKRKLDPLPQTLSQPSTLEAKKSVTQKPNTTHAPTRISAQPIASVIFKPKPLLSDGTPYIPTTPTIPTSTYIPLAAIQLAPVSFGFPPLAPIPPCVPLSTMFASPSAPTSTLFASASSSAPTQAVPAFNLNSSGYGYPSTEGLFSSTAPSIFSLPSQTTNTLPLLSVPELQARLDSLRAFNNSMHMR